MGCCDDVRRVAYFYLDGTLGAAKTQFVKEHLTECPDCDGRVRFHDRLRHLVRTRLAPIAAPAALRDRIIGLCKGARSEAMS